MRPKIAGKKEAKRRLLIYTYKQKSDEVIEVCKTLMSVVRYIIGVNRHHQLCGFHKTIGMTILSVSAPIVRALGIIFVLRSVDPVGLELQKEGSWVYNFTQQLVLSARPDSQKGRKRRLLEDIIRHVQKKTALQ